MRRAMSGSSYSDGIKIRPSLAVIDSNRKGMYMQMYTPMILAASGTAPAGGRGHVGLDETLQAEKDPCRGAEIPCSLEFLDDPWAHPEVHKVAREG